MFFRGKNIFKQDAQTGGGSATDHEPLKNLNAVGQHKIKAIQNTHLLYIIHYKLHCIYEGGGLRHHYPPQDDASGGAVVRGLTVNPLPKEWQVTMVGKWKDMTFGAGMEGNEVETEFI